MDKRTLYTKYWDEKANNWLKNAVLLTAFYVLSLVLEYHWVPNTMVGLALATAGLVITSVGVTWCYTKYADFKRRAEAIREARKKILFEDPEDTGYQIGYVPSK